MRRVAVYRDGNQMAAQIGPDWVEGIAGFGNTVVDALRDLAYAFADYRYELRGNAAGVEVAGEFIQVTGAPGQSAADVLLTLAGIIEGRGFQEADFPEPDWDWLASESRFSRGRAGGTRVGGRAQALELAAELQKIYDSEINVEIGWFWDGGIDVRLGDQMNGYLAEENVSSVAEILPWLQEAIAHFYPTSAYATALDAGIKDRAARRIFSPPRSGARVFCPHCGAPNPAPRMDEVSFFYCARCGNSVEVPEPKVN